MTSTSRSKTSIGSGTTTTTINLVMGTTGDDIINLYDSKYRGFYVSSPSIDGGNGKDVIFGRSSAETISGAAGSDWVNGGGGADRLDGGGGTGVDWLSFQRFKYGDVTYNAYASGVTVRLTDRVFSYDAFEQVNLVAGAVLNFENIFGSDGNDLLAGDERGNEIRGGAGGDLLIGRAGADQIHGDDGNDTLVGGSWRPGDAVLTPSQMRGVGNDNNVLMGGRGNDLLVSAVGNDWIDGGDGVDIVDYSYLPENFSVRLSLVSGGVWTQATVFTIDEYGNEVVYEKDWVRNVEGINGGLADDVISGDPNQPNTISAGPGKDTVVGGEMNDDLDGGQDDDSISGGGGDDLIRAAGGGNDTFDGGSGIDTLSFEPVAGKGYYSCFFLDADNRSLVIDLASGSYSWKQSYIPGVPTEQPQELLWLGFVSEVENITGSRCNDQIAGDSGSNVLDGGSGKDVLYGAGGMDTLRGGKGSDDWAAFKAVTSGNTPDDHYSGGAGDLPQPPDPALALTAAEGISILSDDPYQNGITADLSTRGGWYAYRSASGDWASKTPGQAMELSGTENLLGSAGDDELTGDAVAVAVFAGAMSLMGQGDTLNISYNGVTQTVTIGSGADVLQALQAAINESFGSDVLIADSTNGIDVRIRVVDAVKTLGGISTANTLDGEFIDQVSGLTAREITDSTSSYLAFDQLVAQLSEGDRISFKVGGQSFTLTLGAFTAYGAAGYTEAALKTAIDNALVAASATGVTADIVNGTDLWFRSTTAMALTAGTLQNCVYSDDATAALNNILVGDAGIDQIRGGLGNDTVYGGAGDYDGTLSRPGNQIWGGDGSDTFQVGYDFDPVLDDLAGQDGRTEVAGTDVIHDWDDVSTGTAGSGSGGRDSLLVSASGTAIIGGLAGKTNWNAADQVDLRSEDSMAPQWVVDNLGKIVVATGDGNDTIYGSNGEDWVYAGKGLNDIDLGSSSVDGADRVVINTWQGQYNITGFDSQDKIYIHTDVINIFAPQTWLQLRSLMDISDPTALADMVTGQAYQTDFRNPLSPVIFNPTYSSFLETFPQYDPLDQPIEITLPILGTLYSQALWQSNGAWTNQAHTYSELMADLAVGGAGGYQVLAGTGLLPLWPIGTIIGAALIISGGLMIADAAEESQHLNTTYDNGTFILGEEVQFYVPGFGELPFTPTIQKITIPQLLANSPYTLTFGDFNLHAAALDATPSMQELVAALQADPLYAAGPVTVDYEGNDLLITVKADAATLEMARISSGLTSLVSFMDSQNPADLSDSDIGVWDTNSFLDFYNIPDDEFMPTLEVTSHPINEGIYTIAAVYNGTETFIYLIFSPDRMIQNNETLLLAQVNGRVTADQIVMYDDTVTDLTQYDSGTTTAPVFAPKVSGVVIQQDDSNIDPAVGKLLTSDSTPTVRITFDKPIVAGDVITVTYSGGQVTFTGPATGATSLDVTLPAVSADGSYRLNIGLANADGFTSSFATTINIDANPIPAGDVILLGSEEGIIFGFRQDDPETEANDGAIPEDANITLTMGLQTITPALATGELFNLNSGNGYSKVLAVSAQPSSVTTGTLSVADALGRTTQLSAYSVSLGTDNADAAISGVSGKINFLYGFGGNDAITASASGDYLFGGSGSDTLTGANGADYLSGGDGADSMSAGAGMDILIGGLGADAMTGGDGADIFIWNSQNEFGQGDSIADFVSGVDQLQFNAASLGITGPLLDSQIDYGAGMTTAAAGVVFFLNTTTGDLYFDADGSGSGAAKLVVDLTGVTTLDSGDITLI